MSKVVIDLHLQLDGGYISWDVLKRIELFFQLYQSYVDYGHNDLYFHSSFPETREFLVL